MKKMTTNVSAIALTATLSLLAAPVQGFTLGSSQGTWLNEVGGQNITKGTYGGYDAILWGGKFAPPSLKSGLGYKGETNVSFALGEVFKVGHLKHQNSVVPSGSAIEEVDLQLSLDFDLPNVSESLDFNVTVDETLNVKKVCFIFCTSIPFPVPDQVEINPAAVSSLLQAEGKKYKLDLWFGTPETVNGTIVTGEGDSQKRNVWAKVEKVPEPTVLFGLLSASILGLTLKRKQQA